MIAYAIDLGLPRDRFVDCLDGHRFADAIDTDIEEARKLGVNATPTFFINGSYISGAQPADSFAALSAEELTKATARVQQGTSRAEYYKKHVVDEGQPDLDP